jgi:hypothetical protein
MSLADSWWRLIAPLLCDDQLACATIRSLRIFAASRLLPPCWWWFHLADDGAADGLTRASWLGQDGSSGGNFTEPGTFLVPSREREREREARDD